MAPVTAAGLIATAAARLAQCGSDSPRLDAEVLLRDLLGIDRTALFMRLREPVDDALVLAFSRAIERRLRGEPIAYITGRREFMGHTFLVGPGVLIPRPETEQMVEWALNWLGGRDGATVVDVGAGSGAIVLSLAHGRRASSGDRLVGSDRSLVALGYARHNRAALGLESVVALVAGDLLEPFRVPFDLVLANLPYLTCDQFAGNPDLWMEPALALVSGDNGLDAIRRLIADLPRVLTRGGAVMLELDPAQAEVTAWELSAALPGAAISRHRDLAGDERFVVAQTS